MQSAFNPAQSLELFDSSDDSEQSSSDENNDLSTPQTNDAHNNTVSNVSLWKQVVLTELLESI